MLNKCTTNKKMYFFHEKEEKHTLKHEQTVITPVIMSNVTILYNLFFISIKLAKILN